MKRILSLILAFLLTAALCGCGIGAPQTLSEPMDLPENGVITAEVFAALKENRQVGVFRGADGDIAYMWTVFGAEITQAQDCNFSLHISKATPTRIGLHFDEPAALPFTAMLTLRLPFFVDAEIAGVYRGSAKDANFLCAASVTEEANGSSLHISVSDRSNPLTIVPEKSVFENFETPAATIATTKPLTTAPAATTAPAGTAPATTAAQTTAPSAATASATTKAPQTTAPAATTHKATAASTDAPTTTAAPTQTTCTFSIECASIFNHLSSLAPGKLDALPADGVILAPQTVTITEGESVFDVLQRVCRDNKIPMESTFTPLYNSAYIEGIHNLYEFDCGAYSGWMYRVNGWYPNYGCSLYPLHDGDRVEFRYTCDLGADIGGKNNY